MKSLRGSRTGPDPSPVAATSRARSGRAGALSLGLLMSGVALIGTGPQAMASDPAAVRTDLALVSALDGFAPPPPRKPDTAEALEIATAPRPLRKPDPDTDTDTVAADPDMDSESVIGGRVHAADSLTATAVAALADVGMRIGPATTTPAATTDAPADSASAADPQTHTTAIMEARVDRGDTLIGLLIDSGVDRLTAHKAIKAMEEVFDPRHMRPGHVINIRFAEPEQNTLRFAGFDFEPSAGTRVIVAPSGDNETGFRADEEKATLEREVVRFGGAISSSLYQAAINSGVSDGALGDMIHILSYDIDFQRDIRKNDSFEIMYERFNTPDGDHVRDGRVLFAALTNGGRRMTAYAFKTEDGHWDYFDENGHGVRKPLMRTPIDGARLSSSFGLRKHPILGYSRMHTGVDFAAPTGTPIFAAGDGVVNYAGRKGGYGKYVRIRHNGEFSTAYAHLSRMHVRNGERVEQGEVIGRVGSTGMSTGPHLHYEIIRNGKKVNPMGVRFQPAVKLAGAELERFQTERTAIETLYADLRHPTEIASAAAPADADEASVAASP